MPRNESGVYTLPAGNPVVVGTTIEATWANPTMSDLGNEITASLPRAGTAPMTGPLLLARDGVLSNEAVTVSQLQTQVTGSNNYLPAGAIQAFATSSIPTGWAECDGSAISRTTYSELFATIGTTYGIGNGTTTFNVPDLRGMFVRGLDRTRGVDAGRVLGTTQSPANQTHNHVATVTNPEHTHSVGDPGHNHTLTDPGHAHNVPLSVVAGGNTGFVAGNRFGITSVASDVNTTGITLAPAATGVGIYNATQNTTVGISIEGSESRPYNVAMIYCIKLRGSLQTSGLIESSNVIYTYDVPRTMEDKLSEWVSVLDFGATGDGVTDDYAAFLAAVTNINSLGGGIVFIPPGTYCLGTALQMKGFTGVHLLGSGIDVVKIVRTRNHTAALIRFYLGYYNSVRDLTIDCDGYDGRGLFFQDIGSFAKRVKVINCPDRAIGGNGGSNTVYGLDSMGRESTAVGFTTATFFPEGCYVTECKVQRAGQTAYSFKRMPKFKVFCNEADEVWSEGATIDVRSDYAEVWGNTFTNVCRSDSATEFPDKENGGYLTVGTGGTGGIGIDTARYAKVFSNNIVGVQMNLAEGAKIHPAICFVDNVGATYGVQVWGNHVEDADVGLYMKGVAEGAADYAFDNLIGPNTFKNVLTEYKIDAGCTNNVIERGVAPESGTLSIQCDEPDNYFVSSGGSNALVAEGVGTAGTFTHSANGQRILWDRVGKVTTFSIYLDWTAHVGAVGQLKVEGLPFESSANPNHSAIFACSVDGFVTTGQVYAHIPPGEAYLLFYTVTDGTRAALAVPSVANIRLSGSYQS
jgi:microcystin-dependent protein